MLFMGVLYRLIRLKKTPVGKDCQISCQVDMEHLLIFTERDPDLSRPLGNPLFTST